MLMSRSPRVSSPVSSIASSPSSRFLWVTALYAAITACLYGWTLHFPMVFDDVTYLRDNPLFKAESFGYPWRFNDFATWPQRNGLDPDLAVNFILRPFAYATFYLNSLVSGFEPWSYRLVNLVVHWVNAVLLYQILTLVRPPMSGAGRKAAAAAGRAVVPGASTGRGVGDLYCAAVHITGCGPRSDGHLPVSAGS